VSKRKDIGAIGNLLGNSAAHYALYGEEQREIGTYTSQAEEIAAKRSWNKMDLEDIKKIAAARARSEIRRRMPLLGLDERDEDRYAERAEEFIDSFMSKIVKGTK
jgi:hypothetical protein